MPNNTQAKFNHNLTLRVIELAIITMAITLVLRPLFVTLPTLFTVLNLANLVLALVFYTLVRLDLFPKWEYILSLVIAIILIMPMLALSGGVNSQVACILPLYPVFAALIGGYKESLLVTIFLTVCVVLATIFSTDIVDLSEADYSREKSVVRGFWLTMSIIFSGVFGRFFLKKYTEFTEQLRDENIHDPLTGLLNRRGLSRNFSRELDNASLSTSPLSVLLIDIDYFKKVNDMYGHDTGDICLVQVGKLLADNIRKSDTIARFGGEEFIILLPGTTQLDAVKVAEYLKGIVAQGKFSDFNLPLTITIGITERHPQNDNALKMIKRADKALYKGKDKGRNCVEVSE